MLIAAFFSFSFSFFDKEIVGTSIRIIGDSILTKSYYQSTGNYKAYTEVILDEGITGLGNEALAASSSLKRVYLSSSISYVETLAFRFCYNIQTIEVAKNSTYFLNNDEGLLLSADSTQLVKAPAGGIESITIPTTVTTLLAYCFHGCKVGSIEIPWSVTAITGNILADSSVSTLKFAENSTITSLPEFLGWSNVISIRVPKSVEYMDGSFKYSKLKSVTFEEGSRLKSISNGAFIDTLITRLELPEGLINLNSKAIESAPKLAYITIPSTVEYISVDAFDKTTALETIICRNNGRFVSQNDRALYNSNKSIIYAVSSLVEEIEIGPGMTDIGKTLLQGCTKLTSLKVFDNEEYSSTGGVLYNRNQTTALAVVGGIERAEFVATCTTIGEYCCYSCANLKSVSIPEPIEVISQYSFSKSGLESVSLPSTIREIGTCAFYECTKLRTFDYCDSKPSNISDSCFAQSAIQRITVPSSVRSLEVQCFDNCASLTKIGFGPESICETIRYRAMRECTLLETVAFPSALRRIEDECFCYCEHLSVDIKALSNLISTGTESFCKCNISSIKLGSEFESIGAYSFSTNPYLETVDLTNTKIKGLSASSFEGCSRLSSVKLPAGLEELNPLAFIGCRSLVDADASKCANFRNWDGLVYKKSSKVMVFCPGGVEKAELMDGVEALGPNSFYFCSRLLSIKFPNNSEIAEIPEKTFFQCTSLGSILIPPKVEKIMGGAFFSCTSLRTVEFMEGSRLRSLDNSTFEGCVSLREIIFGEGELASVGSRAFYECRSLTSIRLPSSLEVLGEEAFAECSNLSSVEFGFPSKIQSLHRGLFLNCVSLVEIKVPDSIRKIPKGVFEGCLRLSNVTFVGNSLKEIEESSFKDLNIEHFNFDPSINLDSIGDGAFAGTKIRSARIPLAASIGSGIFEKCELLESVNTEPFVSIKRIPPRTFYGCKLLKVRLSGLNVESIGDESFYECECISTSADPINPQTLKLSPTFGEAVSSIGKGSFRKSGVGDQIVFGPNLKTLGESAFVDTNLQKVYYCGTSEVRIDGTMAVFNRGAVAYVSRDYQGAFCRIGTHHIIDGDCAMPTAAFTAAVGQAYVNVCSIASCTQLEGE